MATSWNYLVVTVDGLNAGLLGPYGNTWVPTRAFNRFAAESWLPEFFFATSADRRDYYRSVWSGRHPFETSENVPSLIETWREEGRHTLLVTDDAEVGAFPEASHFDERREVPVPDVQSAAASTPETHFAQLIGATIERLTALPPKFGLWLHARGMSGPWDAPVELREHVRDDEDPPAATWVSPPALRLEADHDPDELLPITQAYAAQVLVIDECLEALCDAVEDSGLSQNTLVVVTSSGGYLLGQHGYVGSPHDALLEDMVHLPLLVRYPAGMHASERELALLEPRDLYQLLRNPSDWTPSTRDRILMRSRGERAFRTPAWYLRMLSAPHGGTDLIHELYAKPDDRYEVNDVAGRCQDVVTQLVAAADLTGAALREGQELALEPLAEELLDALR